MSEIDIRIIDVHRHCLPKPSAAIKRAARVILEKRIGWKETPDYAITKCKGISSIVYPELMDIQAQIRGQEEAGITTGILSFSMALETMVTALPIAAEQTLTRRLNDATAAMVNRYPGKLAFVAILNPFARYAIRECERCLGQLGAKGVNISTSWKGQFLDSPRLDAFWRFVEDRDIAVFLHPPQVPIGYEYMRAYKLEEMVGRPFDTTMTVTRMIYAGVFDRHPRLKVVLPHMGGLLLMIDGRLDFGYRLGYKGLPKEQIPACLRRPSEYFHTNLYVDTMGFSPKGVKHAIDLLGCDRVLFGSDYAAVPIHPIEHVQMIKGLGLRREDEEKILWKNAAFLFQLRDI